jgi:hypothetical protein
VALAEGLDGERIGGIKVGVERVVDVVGKCHGGEWADGGGRVGSQARDEPPVCSFVYHIARPDF